MELKTAKVSISNEGLERAAIASGSYLSQKKGVSNTFDYSILSDRERISRSAAGTKLSEIGVEQLKR